MCNYCVVGLLCETTVLQVTSNRIMPGTTDSDYFLVGIIHRILESMKTCIDDKMGGSEMYEKEA